MGKRLRLIVKSFERGRCGLSNNLDFISCLKGNWPLPGLFLRQDRLFSILAIVPLTRFFIILAIVLLVKFPEKIF
jgi:hypothetical protein